MRIISRNTLIKFYNKKPASEPTLKSWFSEAKKASWSSPNDVKQLYKNASIISRKRVVFNIKGNDYRLIVDIEYHLKIIFVIWIGSHKEYDKINVKKISYDKTN
jgi:mRNA interferase HigB